MIKTAVFLYLFISIHAHLHAQEFSYVQYDTKDGLAGSTVYDMCQDKNGFIWFATDNGLTRFDGTSFRNFTVKDGLADNEVLKIFADSKGRVWVGSFSNDICYVKDSKVHNKQNDPLVKQLQFKSSIMDIGEWRDSLLFFSPSSGNILLVDRNDKMKELNLDSLHTDVFIPLSVVLLKNHFLIISPKKLNTKGTVLAKTYLFNCRPESPQLTKFSETLYENANPRVGISFNDSGIILKSVSVQGKGVTRAERSDNHTQFMLTTNGAWFVDTLNAKLELHVLKGKKISRAFIDKENNYWFSTFGEGVYKLPSKQIQSFVSEQIYESGKKEVFSITRSGNTILAGINFSKMLKISQFKASVTDFGTIGAMSEMALPDKRLYTSKTLQSGFVMLGFDGFLLKLDGQKAYPKYIYPVKSVEEIDRDHILVGTSAYAFKLRVSDLEIVDTIWNVRCTKVFYLNNRYFIGTLSGLYEVNEDKTSKYLGILHPALSRRITDIKLAKDGSLWISSSDNGIVSFKDGKISNEITEKQGLSSNICRTLFIKNNFLWVGTNKGLNKIDISKHNLPIIKYSISDGLPSDVINAVYAEDSIVWVGSPAGLTYFNENKISNTSICNLILLEVKAGDSTLQTDSSYKLSYKENNISFNYVAVSFKSGGEITYHYRLTGLHNDWRTTKLTNLEYQALPSGDYELQLYAVNKFGVTSKTLSIPFTIATPFWKTWWFYLLLALLFISGLVLLLQRRNKKKQAALEERNKVQKQFAQLEQQALQAQMNPHFIFNCLNSIQQYVVTNDVSRANEYLTGFASLVRQTLDYSEKKTITVGEEARYLQQYIEMEKMRFGDNFLYTVNIDKDVDEGFNELPALLLQPFVENSLRHGLRYKKEGQGRVDISFSLQQSNLLCRITDNGIGREKALEYKSQQHIEYQSKGMSLAQKRVDLLNKIRNTNIEITVTDLYTSSNEASGTQVTVKIPQ